MYIKADSGNYVARLFYILYGVRHLRPHKGRKLGVDLE